jgi:hypothetical protein
VRTKADAEGQRSSWFVDGRLALSLLLPLAALLREGELQLYGDRGDFFDTADATGAAAASLQALATAARRTCLHSSDIGEGSAAAKAAGAREEEEILEASGRERGIAERMESSDGWGRPRPPWECKNAAPHPRNSKSREGGATRSGKDKASDRASPGDMRNDPPRTGVADGGLRMSSAVGVIPTLPKICGEGRGVTTEPKR